jgi:hypothetical protein
MMAEKRTTEEIIQLKEHLLELRRRLADAYLNSQMEHQVAIEDQINSTLKKLKELELMSKQMNETSVRNYLKQHPSRPVLPQTHHANHRERQLSEELQERLYATLRELQKLLKEKKYLENELQNLKAHIQQLQASHSEELELLRSRFSVEFQPLQEQNRQLIKVNSTLEADIKNLTEALAYERATRKQIEGLLQEEQRRRSEFELELRQKVDRILLIKVYKHRNQDKVLNNLLQKRLPGRTN